MAEQTQSIGPRVAAPPSSAPGWLFILVPYVLGLLLLGGSLILVAQIGESRYAGRIAPGVTTMGIDLGGYTPAEADTRLRGVVEHSLRTPIVLRVDAREWVVPAGRLGLRFDIEQSVNAAVAASKNRTPFDRVGFGWLVNRAPVTVSPPAPSVDRKVVEAYLQGIAPEIARKPVDARLELMPGQRVVLVPATPGRELDIAATAEQVVKTVHALESRPVALVTRAVPAAISEADLIPVKNRAERMLGEPIVLQFEDKKWEISREQIATAIAIERSAAGAPVQIRVDTGRFRALVEEVNKAIARPSRNPRFEVGANPRIIAPGSDGRALDVEATLRRIGDRLDQADRTVALPTVTVKPALTTENAGRLAQLERIEQASTVYGGTMTDRMFNIELAMSRLNGTVIAPGETFSFNDAVGEVSFRTGYKRGYGITQSGGEVLTIPRRGGGICQVATTLFQSVFWAGYPIVERNWHLYWIPRYGQPPRGLQGLDATIRPGLRQELPPDLCSGPAL